MNYQGFWLELLYLTLKFVAHDATKSGESKERGSPAVRNEQCPGEGRRGLVPADSPQEMKDTDLKWASGEKMHV